MHKIIKKIKIRLYKWIQSLKGLDTYAYESTESLGLNKEIANHYSTSEHHGLQVVFDSLLITPEDSIIDFGSGKGGFLMFAAKYSFKRIIGVELSEKLVEIANQNIKIQKLTNRIKSFNMDAREFVDIEGVSFFYFYNPFPCQVFSKVIRNILENYNDSKKCIYIIYNNPKCENVLHENNFTLQKKFYLQHVVNVYSKEL